MKSLLIIISIIVFIGSFKLSIGYYTFLRIAATIGAVAIVVVEFENGINSWVIIFGMVAVLFNPIFPVYLHSKSSWQIIDLLTGILFLVKAILLKNQKSIT